MYLQARKGMILTRDIEQYPEGIVLVIDKPYRWTSADVIRKVKFLSCKFFGKKNLKVGHAGTLDPLATGVLIVCIGKATKLAEDFHRHDKEYIAGVSFGATTPSYDREKEIDAVYSLERVSRKALDAVLPSFMGEQEQVAPLFSAKSVDGVRAYETARRLYRAGKFDAIADSEILNASRIRIARLEIMDFYEGPASSFGVISSDNVREPDAVSVQDCCATTDAAIDTQVRQGFSDKAEKTEEDSGSFQELQTVTDATILGREPRIRVAPVDGFRLRTADVLVGCSKGTYIRALARDFGEALGSGAFLTSLRRTASGPFRISDALTLADVAELFPRR